MTQVTTIAMIDLETLGLGADAVVTQVGAIIAYADDPETPVRTISEYLPIQPQMELGRKVDASTLIWWLTSPDVSDEARKGFLNNRGDDMDELLALVRSVVRKIRQELPEDREQYEIWARGPQFDIVKIESLFAMCGQDIPWAYDRVRDLRTAMSAANLSSKDVPMPADLTPHVAVDDARFQMSCLAQTFARLQPLK